MSLLTIDSIHSYYGHIHALKGISVEVNEGEIVTLIGSNGAGKSTALRTISGMIHPKKGRIVFDGKDISRLEPHEIVYQGMVHVPEGRGILPTLTVKENLEMGAFTVDDANLVEERMENGFNLFPRLKERIDQFGGTLSGGEQQMLAIARGLMLNPRLLMLDEPSMGLAPILVELIFDIIKKLNDQGTTILLVEQNALMALSIAHRGYVLQTGEITVTDSAVHLRSNKAVRKAYLGMS
jgi:branched-chain amino acid transport system ATP-binding protein